MSYDNIKIYKKQGLTLSPENTVLEKPQGEVIYYAKEVLINRPEYNFLNPDRLPGRNDVTSDKVNFRPDVRQNFLFEKN